MKKYFVFVFAAMLITASSYANVGDDVASTWGACDNVTGWVSQRSVVSLETTNVMDANGYSDSTSMHIGDYTGSWACNWNAPATSGLSTGVARVSYSVWQYCDTDPTGYADVALDRVGGSGRLATISGGFGAAQTTGWHNYTGDLQDTFAEELLLCGRANKMVNAPGFVLIDSVTIDEVDPVNDWYLY